jgi:serine/threonine-protein kinase
MNEPPDPTRTIDVPAVPAVNEPHDPNRTVEEPSVPTDALDAGLAAGFGPPRSSLGDLRPVLLKEAEGESAHMVQPKSDAMPPPEQTGDRYQLQGEIACGGMGAVLRGRDVDLGRDLAIKVLLEKYADRPDVARRFLGEAQVGAQLQHPGVVPVYDIGRFGDRPFFTMKLVKGKTLAALLSERADPTADRPRLLGIALQVAQALAYAHAKGVIHRDLKPANIMVGAFGEVQVMDWGLAKVLAEGGVAEEEKASRERERPEDMTTIRTARSRGSGIGTDTEAGSLLGTPAYMPPEQANGDVALLDRRADAFGLGAILCEVLTGKPPYVGRSAEEVRRKAANGDLADALTRLESCGADTELIVLTKACLAPEVIDRPKDAQAVADRLTAYLDGVQERLHQAELAEAEARARAIEEAKRRRLTLAWATTVLLAVTLGGGGWLWVKNERDARQAQLTREVNDALNQASALREQSKAATVGSTALFAQAREQAQRALALIENGPADAALTEQVRRLQADLDEEEKDRALMTALDEARLAQAETLSENRFATERAVPKFREAFAAYGLAAGDGDPKLAAERIRQRPAPVKEAILAALDEWDDLAGRPKLGITEPHPEWLRAVLDAAESDDAWGLKVRAARREPDRAKRQAALEALAASADVEHVPVRVLTRLASPGQLADWNGLRPPEAAKLLRRAQRRYPADFWVNHFLGLTLQEVKPPERDEAVRFLTAAVALRPDSPGAVSNLGVALADNGRVDEAIACYQKAIALDPKYATPHNNLGAVLCDVKKDYDAAIACFRKAIALDHKYAQALSSLGNALKAKGQVDAALACYRKAIEIDPKYTKAHLGLGQLLAGKGQVDEAIACYQKALTLDPEDSVTHHNLGSALYDKGQFDAAIACYRKALTCLKGADANNRNLAVIHDGLGNALQSKGEIDQAIASYQKAITLDPKYAEAHNGLGALLAKNGRMDEASACLQRALELDPKDAKNHSNLGLLLKRMGRMDEAIAEYKKALSLDPKFAAAHRGLGAVLCDLKGDYDGAIACFRQAIALDPQDVEAHTDLGIALRHKGQMDEAIASHRKAIALNPKDASAHEGLGTALYFKDLMDEAIASYRKALSLDPKHAQAHYNLGLALARKGQRDQAIASFKRAIQLEPKDAEFHRRLGVELEKKGQHDEAIASFQKAIALNPMEAENHYSLGNGLRAGGQFDAAIVSYKKAIALAPNYAEAYCNMGGALASQGRFAESLAAIQRGHELGSKQTDWRYPSEEWVRQAKRSASLEARLPAVLKGELQPKGTVRLEFATICQAKQFHHAAARLYADALAADPELADDLQKGHRYNAACSAALAAAGQGRDAVKPDDKERTRLRQQALDWLRADLSAYTKLWESDPTARRFVRDQLKHWQEDSDLASLRGEAALAKLPAEAHAPFTRLWADVAALLKKAQPSAQKESK